MNPFVKFEKGSTLDCYRLESVLGRGRSAIVVKALDQRNRSWAALKVLDPFLVQDPVSVERFKREASALRVLNHPAIISIHSVFSWEDSHCIAMEYFEGENLRTYLDKVGRVPVAQFLPLAKQLLAAIAVCHHNRVLHRDLKPQNVLINGRNELKLVDFGISKVNSMSDLTKTGTFLGTPEYMAPEMFHSSISDGRVDIYGLGALFFEILLGKSPYFGLSIQHVMAKQAAGAIPELRATHSEIPEWIECIVRKCLSTNPDHRYSSIFELESDFEKTGRAIAVIEKEKERLACWECQEELVAGVPFCVACGAWFESSSETGPYSIVINRVDGTIDLAAHAEKRLPLRLISGWRKKLRRRPFILVSGLGEKTAKVIFNLLSPLPIQASIARNLSREMRLPWWLVGLDAVLMSPVILRFLPVVNIVIPTPIIAFYLMLSQIPVLLIYWRQTQPVAKLQSRASLPGADEEVYRDWYPRLMEIKACRIRRMTTAALHSFASLSRRHRSEAESTQLRVAFEQAFQVATTLGAWEEFLSSTSLNDLKEKERELDAKIRNCGNQNELQSLISLRGQVKMSFENYRSIQGKYGELYLSLMNFQTLLRRLEDDADRAWTELQALDSELTAVSEAA